ncbi:MAG: TauD/TfdA family dioxygenase [Catenulispora sp.]|nr:TauD/TfdA family dioxygenase [Catenulispora sp.]
MQTLAHIIEADPADPAAFFEAERPIIRKLLLEHGAVLLRGFRINGVAGFQQAVQALSGDPLVYAERSSPRHSILGNVYTSTDYPPHEEIFLHNENSYQASWPRLLWFYCDAPAETLGATPLADIRRVHAAIDPQVREEFAAKGWMVVRNFHPHLGVPWRSVFNTDDRAQVEQYAKAGGLRVEWFGKDGLRTRAVRRAVHRHPDTGEDVWFNHAIFFHHTTLAPDVQQGLLAMFGEDELPSNTYYGDGTPIPPDVAAHLRQAYRDASTRFDWQQDDILIVENMLAAHGREPYTGTRRIAVAMTELFEPDH